jgi:ABC-type branched-subunit amino acid transport system permease subunit
LGTLHGPIIGALAFTGLTELPQVMGEWKPFATIFNAIGLPKVGAFLQPLSERPLLLEGVIILLVVLALPKGLSGITLPRWLRDKMGGHAPAAITPASAAEVRPNG